MEFVTESGGIRGHSGPRGACCGEWSGVHCPDLLESGGAAWNPLQRVEQEGGSCRDLSESGGAAWNPLQRVEQDGGSSRDLSESLDSSAEARLGCLMEQNDSLHCHSRRGSDVPRLLMNLLLSDADLSGGSHLL